MSKHTVNVWIQAIIVAVPDSFILNLITFQERPKKKKKIENSPTNIAPLL